MSIVMQMKKCPKCGKKYSWNPDVGNFRCPHCGGLGSPKKNGAKELLDKLIKKN